MTTSNSTAPGLNQLCALSRDALYYNAVKFFRHGGGTEPHVALVAHGDARAVFKDYGRDDGWFSRLIGPLLIDREITAMRRLAGLAGIPVIYKRIDRWGMLIEYLPAEPWNKSTPPASAYQRLDRLVSAMHARGVAHCDMRSPSNILVDAGGQPYLVDFVSRVMRGPGWNFVWRWVFAKFCMADHSGVSKLRVRYAPQLASESDQRFARPQGVVNRSGRLLGRGLRQVLRFIVGAS